MQPLEGFLDESNKINACLSKKYLSGLKQLPMQCYKRFDFYMLENGLCRNSFDNCVYYKQVEKSMIYLLLYVNDILIACKKIELINIVKYML